MCRSRFAQSMRYDKLGKLGRLNEDEEEEELEIEWRRKKTLLGWVLGVRLEQVFCYDSAITLEITVEI